MARRFIRVLASSLVLNATFPLDVLAQTNPAAIAQPPATAQPFSAEQLDALVASIALYPDELLTQLLMASTFPLEIVAAARWVEDPAHKSLSGDALAKALEAEPWDPSVKSLVPFPVVLATMNSNLTWLQQLGYAFATQQADVFAAVQRLRRLAQANDKLQSSPQQVVSTQQVTVEPPTGSSQPPTQQEVIVIQPAQSDTVYVPSYNPTVVYGSSWPYPSYPPYYAAPPPGYYFGTALATGLAFAAGAAVVGGLWGWASPAWGGGYANVNVNRFNNINVNRSQITSSRWNSAAAGGGGRQFLSRTERTGRPSRPFASLRTGQCSKAPHPRRRCRGRWQRRWRGVATVGLGASGGQAAPCRRRRCGSSGWRWWCRWGWWRRQARRPRQCRRRRRCGSSGWRWWCRWGWWRRQARRPRRCRRRRRCGCARVAWVALAVQVGLVAPAGRPSSRLAEANASRVRSVRAVRSVI